MNPQKRYFFMSEQQLTLLRFGIMVDDLVMERWKVQTIEKLVDGGMILALVIRNATTEEKKGFFQRMKGWPVRRLLFQRWNHRQFKPHAKEMVDLWDTLSTQGQNLEEIPILDCEPTQKGISTIILDNDIQNIKNHQLDFILRFGFGIIKGDILNAAKYGVWSFHHDDEMEYRGGPPGFWEWMEDVPRNGVILQRLTEDLDKGYILNKRWYPTILHAYKAHLDQLLFDSTEMPLQVCRQIQHTGELKQQLSESKAPIRRPPANFKMLGYWIKCLTRRWRFHWHDLFRQEDWNVGYLEVPLKRFVEEPESFEGDVIWFKKRRRRDYYADPFVITTEKDTYIFFEHYSYKKGKGWIEVAKKSQKFKKFHVALEEEYHLSYPFVFSYEGEVYCLPEGNDSQRLNLYRFNEKKMVLEQEGVLMEHVRAIDPTLCYRDGRWNLFFTQKDYPSVKLYRYVSNELKGDYMPYFGNPVKVDCADARMAGAFFTLDGKLLRPAQECCRYYGTAVCLNQIDSMNDLEYSEKQIDKIQPFRGGKFKQGFHTLNGNDTMTVFDGKRWIFTFSGLSHQMKLKRNKNV